MSKRISKTAVLVGLCCATAIWSANALSQEAQYEVLTRGPIHEAFLEHSSHDPQPGITVSQAPPEPIDELPPEHKPADQRAIWISGYWGFDQVAEEFIWISGVWRVPPPNSRWVPGYWHEVDQGFQWISGAWIGTETTQIQYYDRPPKSVERGPASRAPSANHFWVSGYWTYDGGKYRWRAGTWVPRQAGWTWTPDRYVYTPRGYVYVRGHWDHTFAARGLVFAPIRLNSGTAAATRVAFSPDYVIPHQHFLLHLFVHSPSHHYYVGDYYDDRYADRGFRTWFAVDNDHRGYDPHFDYYLWSHRRGGTDLLQRLTKWNRYFVSHPQYRPPVTLANQLTFASTNAKYAYLANAVISEPLSQTVSNLGAAAFVSLTAKQRADWRTLGLQTNALATQRIQLEGADSALNAAGNTVGVLKLPAVKRDLPGIGVPVVRNVRVPDEPRKLLNSTPVLRDPIGPVRGAPGGGLPKLPF